MHKVRIGKMSALILILLSVMFGIFGQLSLKRGMSGVGVITVGDLLSSRVFSILTEKFVILGVFMYFMAAALWVVVLSREEVSFAYPLIGIGYIFTAILARVFFNESLTLIKLLGILFIAVGAYLIVLKI